jgi:hypothetical protein
MTLVASASEYTLFVNASRLVRIGNSLGIIIPRRALRQLSWWQADAIEIQVQDGMLVLRNLQARQLQPIHTRPEYGDAISRKA